MDRKIEPKKGFSLVLSKKAMPYWLGALVVVLFYHSARDTGDKPFRHLWLTVVISFACYIPVVLFADTLPPVGMLMIPKTCAYVWIVLIGYNAMRKE